MKKILSLASAAIISLFGALPFATIGCHAQIRAGDFLPYEVMDGDTVYFDVLDASKIMRKGKGKKGREWQKYYKLVYNFNKVYPYALVGRKMMAQVDSTIEADVTKKSQRNQYINSVERELLHLFEKDIRNMTISQGAVLLRLVDRECGMSGYEIIKNYESAFAANFWQLIAKIFAHDLKTRYDPTGKDIQIEELTEIWDSGQWDSFYLSVFGEYPTKVEIGTDVLKSEVRKR